MITPHIVGILSGIRSLHNVGSIFRTADAVGVEKLYLCGITPTPLDRFGMVRPQLAKVALGAEKNMPWEKCASTSRLIDRLKKEGYYIIAVEQNKKAIPYYTFKPSHHSRLTKWGEARPKGAAHQQSRIGLILGSEVKGLPQGILAKADTIVEIPMRGTKESLNVSVAFGIVAFHIRYHS